VGLGDREGWGPRRMYLGGGYGKAPRIFLGGPLLKKGVALRASPGLVARRLAAMLLCWRVI